ncbi:hypothetical protein SAMN04488109_1846 [Chryseolinea serpens]|uniref:Uncharacterized protein n=1 Tax=Chryseolinea serpens TaxID=947013 RepID=A0A1M5MNY4_9BACT|nr:hypothetical protein [Chryseolinea serpens]SHG78981.1 hypothetical protein SAMN04488109_1846 [Chryseolinea serpens]
MENPIKLNRKQLYVLVWSTPLSSLAKTYNISDNGLRQMCKKLEIPLPKNGYWQKIKFGKQPRKIEFKAEYPDKDEIVLEVVTEETIRRTTIVDKVKERQMEIELALGEKLKVPERLSKPEDLVTATKERAAASSKRDWSSKVFSIYPNELNISGTDALLPRSLRFFDSFIKVLKLRGHAVTAENRETVAILFGEEIKIRLREKDKLTREMDGKWPQTRRDPTGVLYFGAKPSFTIDKVWIDGPRTIEQQLSNIVAYLEIKGEERREERRLREIRHKKEEELARQRKEYRQRQERELDDFKLLLSKVKRWQQLNLIRGYVDELETTSLERNIFTEEIQTWVTWARKKADWYDPQINADDELLSEVDKETLTLKRESFW